MISGVRALAAARACALALVAASCGAPDHVDLQGAGATLPAPLVTAMADVYRDLTDRRVTANYQSIGSGGGIRQFIEQTVMFGVTERYLTDEHLAEVKETTGGTAFNIPLTLGDAVPIYNLPGVGSGIVFDGPLLADLFLGKVTRWDDERIAELNPAVELPALPVHIVHRSDGSGTTFIWTSFLSKVSARWAQEIGFSTSVNWPAGMGANGNEGVAGVVQNTVGALGYSPLAYAALSDIPYGHVVNRAGRVIEPSLAATTAAADVELPPDTRALITDTEVPGGYPAAGFAWLLLHENLGANSAIRSRAQAAELLRFVVYVVTEGQDLAEPLSFARLPEPAVDTALGMIAQVKWRGEPLGQQVLAEIERDEEAE